MQLSSLARDLYDEISELTIIDAHEHLPPEADYLAFEYCGPNLFAGGYIWHDLESAGMSPEFKETLRDGGYRPVEEWWPQIRPHWECAKHTSYARALRVTARDLWGIADINDDTIEHLSEQVRAENQPGLYHRSLQERCRIRYSITCVDQAAFPHDPGICGITSFIKLPTLNRESLEGLSTRAEKAVQSLDDLVDAVQGLLRADLAAGAVGFKMTVGDYGPPDPAAAEREFQQLLGQTEPDGAGTQLRNFLFDKSLDVAAEADVPVAVHTGYWGDFRELDPKFMLGYAARRGDVRFDMFHLGMPMVRDAALIGKNLPNVTLNLTWCPVISQLQTARMLNELIDLAPLNKIIAFGGDYRVSVQKVYGHLVCAREVVAVVLAKRLGAGDFDHEEALHIAKLWVHDNPARIYRREV